MNPKLAYLKAKFRDDFNVNEPRKADGEWTEGGGVSPKGREVKLHPTAVNVGGDDWNRSTAIRLETEYQTAKDDIEKTYKDAVGAALPLPKRRQKEDKFDDVQDLLILPEDSGDEGVSGNVEWNDLSAD